jgi:hypothetical protein
MNGMKETRQAFGVRRLVGALVVVSRDLRCESGDKSPHSKDINRLLVLQEAI